MWDKIRKFLYEVCDIMELLMAVAVVAGLVIAVVSLVPDLQHYWANRTHEGEFLIYLDAVFNIVIGIEFMKMLCKPNSANIIEALIFLIARHMIIGTTTAGEDLLSIISIAILFLFRRFMLMTKPNKNQKLPNLFHVIKAMQSPVVREMIFEAEEKDLRHTEHKEEI